MRLALLFFCCFVGSYVVLPAQDVRVRAWLDTASMRIGEQTRLRLSIEHTSGIQVQFPFIADSIVSKVEVVDRTAIDSTVQENGRALQRQTFTITSFDDGAYEIPPLTFTYRKPKDEAEYSIQTQALALTVSGVPLPKVPLQDSTQFPGAPSADAQSADAQAEEQDNLRDIKPPLAVPLTFLEVAPYLVAGIALLGAIVWGVWYYRKRRALALANMPVAIVPKRPPYEVAMEGLERLREQRLWQSGAVKEYYTELSEIMRVYVEGTFGIITLEATTDEIIAAMRTKSTPIASTEMLRNVLELADMVKFARYEAVPDEHERSLRLATEYVQITAFKEQTASEEIPKDVAA